MTRHAVLLVCLAACSAVAPPAFATLGGDVGSIESDRMQVQGTRHVSQTLNYAVHDITQPDGTQVREYVTLDGTVFGVAWQGPFQPDLRTLFGDANFAQFTQGVTAQRAARGGRRPVSLDTGTLVVHTRGHMRAFAGQAYLPSLLPPGVSAADIR